MVYGSANEVIGGVHTGSVRVVTQHFGGIGAHFCHATANSSGDICRLLASDLPGVGAGKHLEVQGGPPGQFGYLLVGSGANASSPIPIQFGLLCLDATGGNIIGRYNFATGGRFSVGEFDGNGVLQNLTGTSTVGSGFDVPVLLPVPGSAPLRRGRPGTSRPGTAIKWGGWGEPTCPRA